MARHDIITIGGSAGAVEAMMELIPQLQADLPAALFVVIHTSSQADHVLPRLLDRRSGLHAASAVDGEPIEHGRIYIAPPDHHLLLKPGQVRVVRGPRENRHRPAIDPLFRSAAVAYGSRVISVILSGSLDDGASGLRAIKRFRGIAVVQDPNDALFPGMPLSAIEHVQVNYRLPVAEMAPLLVKLVYEEAAETGPMSEDVLMETRMSESLMTSIENEQRLGRPASLVCPECGGALWEIDDQAMLRYRCHVGRGYTADNLLVGQADMLEHALWAALRVLRERAEMLRRLAAHGESLPGAARAELPRQRERGRASCGRHPANAASEWPLQRGELRDPFRRYPRGHLREIAGGK